MERNWLIRTTQNQILGPVPKAKVIEFLQKSALGLQDEVTSGNGHWFSLKEKDLVEKYLYGDIPQGYNPISESRSVLFNRENPDKTSSLNNAPINKGPGLKLDSNGQTALPANEDLEYPDITIINNTIASQLNSVIPSEKISPGHFKVPKSDDLSFPDGPSLSAHHSSGSSAKGNELVNLVISSESIVYPEAGDLDYPDLGGLNIAEELSVPPVAPAKVVEKKKTNVDFNNEVEGDSGLSLVYSIIPEERIENEERPEKVELPAPPVIKKEKKIKFTAKGSVSHEDSKEVTKETVKEIPKEITKEEVRENSSISKKDRTERTMPDHLKKRNDSYLMYVLIILVLIVVSLFFYYYRTILNKPLLV
jgi:hypothetical protein